VSIILFSCFISYIRLSFRQSEKISSKQDQVIKEMYFQNAMFQ